MSLDKLNKKVSPPTMPEEWFVPNNFAGNSLFNIGTSIDGSLFTTTNTVHNSASNAVYNSASSYL